ncbi:hypothetical protein C8R43DRAFT_1009104 [Mycena crocata]|nr:hypothetical protein C8R43DRAFT_1009085 [Mycena crocata]KAJ7148470.1 hypothetical protein C8R43DRAFT_1009104 [Mycena crocata]
MVAGYWSTHFSIRTSTKSTSNSASAYINYTKYTRQHPRFSTVNQVAHRNYAQIAPAMSSLRRAPPTSIKDYYYATANAFFKSDVCLPSTKACTSIHIGLKQRRNYAQAEYFTLNMRFELRIRIQDSFIFKNSSTQVILQGHCSIFRLALPVQPFSPSTAVVCMYIQLYALQQFRTSLASSQYVPL